MILQIWLIILCFDYFYLVPIGEDGSEDSLPGEIMMALCRVFSGVLKRNSKLYLMSNRYDPLLAYNVSQFHMYWCFYYFYIL